MKGAVILAVLMVIAVATATKYGDACTHTGIQTADDAACVGQNNNMLCSTANKCECIDKYGSVTTDKYAPAADNLSCVKV